MKGTLRLWNNAPTDCACLPTQCGARAHRPHAIVGLERFQPLPITVRELPPIDLCEAPLAKNNVDLHHELRFEFAFARVCKPQVFKHVSATAFDHSIRSFHTVLNPKTPQPAHQIATQTAWLLLC